MQFPTFSYFGDGLWADEIITLKESCENGDSPSQPFGVWLDEDDLVDVDDEEEAALLRRRRLGPRRRSSAASDGDDRVG